MKFHEISNVAGWKEYDADFNPLIKGFNTL